MGQLLQQVRKESDNTLSMTMSLEEKTIQVAERQENLDIDCDQMLRSLRLA